MSKVGKAAVRIGAAAVAVATVAGALSSGVANADTYVPLPNGKKIVANDGGFKVVLRSDHNHVNIIPSLATAQTRTTWVTTQGYVDISGGKDITGTLNLSFVSGCQFPGAISVGLGATGPGVSASVGTGGPGGGLSAGGASAGLNIPLSPGTTSGVTGNAGQYPWTSILDNVTINKPGTWSVGLKDYDVNYGNCSGYAQARVVTWVELTGNNRVEGFLYGAPFSLG